MEIINWINGEDSPPNPENTYAHTHLQAENATLEFKISSK